MLVIPGMSFSRDGDLTSNKGLGDYWVIKLDSNLNLVWKKSLGGSAWEMSYRTKQLSDNYFLTVGGSESNDGDAAGNHGNRDGWVIKFAP